MLKEELEHKSISSESIQSKLLDITLRFDAIIRESIVVDWYNKSDIIGGMKIKLSDIIFDEIKIGMK